MGSLAIVVLAMTLGQPAAPLAGTWTAEYHGTIYVRLVLTDGTGGAQGSQGSMSIAHSIHVDEEGRVDDVTPAASTLTPMREVRRKDGVLSFAISDGDDTDRFEFRLVDANHAELTPIFSEQERQELADERIPFPKPFRLTRAR